ncbi:MAG TPA: aspartate aminotransferase family protein [Phycisphaerae bacterium]|nr:aspartate aminotransferase family protein [Phycisphaerae bacterium]
MKMQTEITRSAELFARAQKVLPGGVSRNAILRSPHPAYVDHGEGCRVTDIDGVTRIDFSNNMASLIHGHAHPEIVRVVSEQMARGTAFMMGTEAEVLYAEHLCSRSPSFEMLRFVNSGTEAIMVAIKASRAHTEKYKIAKVEGAYHGVYDYAEVSQAPTPSNWGSEDHPQSVPLVHGTPDSTLHDVVVLPFNDTERAIKLLNEHADEIACVLLDLMPHRAGLNLADPGYLEAIQNWVRENNSLLVLDEVITFRTEHGGLQSRYNITPDLTALGKIIGGGFPIGAVAGRAEIMDVLNPGSKRYLFPHSGTFSANPISTSAGDAAMKLFDQAAVKRLNALAERATAGINKAIASTGARASVTGGGSMLRVHMKENAPRNFRESFNTDAEKARLATLLEHLFDSGFIMVNTCSATLSTPMTEVEIDALVAAMESGFAKIASMP